MSNKMKELAGIFGLELGEEFTIKGRGSNYYPCVFTEDGLVDKDGNILPDSSILSIQVDGTLRTFGGVGNNLGLKLDDDGRIIIDND